MKKILTNEEVDGWVAGLRQSGKRLGYTCGAFDLLHAGHVDYLNRSRELCDALLVAVNSDDSIRRYKDPLRPVNSLADRMTVMAALECVDAVTPLEEDRPAPQLERWKPDLYIKGGDYGAKKLRSAEIVTAYGGQVVTIPVRHDISTSRIMERIAVLAATAKAAEVPGRDCKSIVFLDRDGTLLKDVPYLSNPDEAELLPGVGEALAALQQSGFRLVMVTNQQGIGLGYFSARDFIAVNAALFRLLTPFGVTISRIYYCPHSAADACDCRKPAPGLLLRALQDFSVSPDACFFIGDREADAEAAVRAGCRPVLVGNGGDGNWPRFAGLKDAAEWIIAQPAPGIGRA